MEVFFITVQIVAGVLSPVFVLALIKLGIETVEDNRERREYKLEQLKKEPPFDSEAEFYKVPNPTMQGVRLKKDGVVVWDGAIDN